MEQKIALLRMLLSNTFLNTTRKNYLIEFENSNVVDEMEAIYDLDAQLRLKTPTRQVQKEVRNVELIIETYTHLINEYLKRHDISKLPINLKRYNMLNELLTVSPSANKLISDLHKHFITPPAPVISEKERIKRQVNSDMATNFKPKNNKKK